MLEMMKPVSGEVKLSHKDLNPQGLIIAYTIQWTCKRSFEGVDDSRSVSSIWKPYYSVGVEEAFEQNEFV